MQECRWIGPAEKPCQLDLAAGRVEQVLAANHNRHPLQPVIDGDRKLIRPASMSIANEEVAALFGRPLLLRSEPEISEALCRRVEPHAKPQRGPFSKMFVRTSTGVSMGAYDRSRALAGINEIALAQLIERPLVNVAPFALPNERLVRREAQPVEIVQQRIFEFRPAARSIVILNPQQHPATAWTRKTPDMDRIDDMPEVEIAGRRRCESCDDADPDVLKSQNTYFNPNWI